MFSGILMGVVGGPAAGTLARPSEPAFSAAPGAFDGEVILTVSDLPGSWGDLSAPGDGLGGAGILEWWNEVDGWQTLSAATGAFTRTLSPLIWGATTTIMVRGVSGAGQEGAAAIAEVAVPSLAPAAGASISTMEIGSTFEVT